MRRVRELDGLRAVAILLVLGCHFEGFSQLAWKIPEFGWIGVEVFFALSGYLITTILLGLRTRRLPYRTFYSRRFFRIMPPYAVVVLVLVLSGLHSQWLTGRLVVKQVLFLQASMPGMWSLLLDTMRHPVWRATHLPSLLAGAHSLPEALTGLPPSAASVPGIFWSLSVEEYFYLLWAPVVLRCSRAAMVGTGGVICVMEMLLRWNAGSQTAYFGLTYRFDSLIYGAFLAIFLEYWRTHSNRMRPIRLLSWLGAAALLGLGVIAGLIGPILGRDIRWSPLFLVFGLPLLSVASSAGVGLLVLRADSGWWPARLLRTRPLQFVGTVSYTMYLVHLLAYMLVFACARRVGLQAHLLEQAIVTSLVTLGLAQISWRFLESPILQWKDRKFPSQPHPAEPAVSWVAPGG